jgi:hypothetical protein
MAEKPFEPAARLKPDEVAAVLLLLIGRFLDVEQREKSLGIPGDPRPLLFERGDLDECPNLLATVWPKLDAGFLEVERREAACAAREEKDAG